MAVDFKMVFQDQSVSFEAQNTKTYFLNYLQDVLQGVPVTHSSIRDDGPIHKFPFEQLRVSLLVPDPQVTEHGPNRQAPQTKKMYDGFS